MLFTLGILVAEIVLSIKMQKKKNSVLRLVLGAIPSIVATFVWPLIPLEALWWMAIKYFVIFALTFIMIIAAVDENVWTYIFIGVMAYCMQHISNQLFAIIDIFTGIVVHRWAGMSLLVVISVIVYFVTYLFFVRVWHSGERIEISSRKLLVLSVIALSVTVVVSLYGAAYSLRLQDKSLFIITCVFSVISCVLCMALGRLLVKSKKSEIEVSVLKRLLYESRHQFEESKSSIEIINIKCHDLKHHINALGQKVDKEELACISDAINIYDNSFRTGNDALDIILMEKALLCSARHIRFTCMIDGAHPGLRFVRADNQRQRRVVDVGGFGKFAQRLGGAHNIDALRLAVGGGGGDPSGLQHGHQLFFLHGGRLILAHRVAGFHQIDQAHKQFLLIGLRLSENGSCGIMKKIFFSS